LSGHISPPEYATSFTRAWLRTAAAAELAYQELWKSLQHIRSYSYFCGGECITSGVTVPHIFWKCSALRIRAVVNKFIQGYMDFRYSGDWTGMYCVHHHSAEGFAL